MPAEDKAPAGIAVEAMRERRRMRQAEPQSIEAAFEIRAATGTGVDRDPGRLVDDQYEPVAIEDSVS